MIDEIRDAEYGERISTTGGPVNNPCILHDDPRRRHESELSKEAVRITTIESNQADERIMRRVERLLKTHESLEAPLAALLT